MGLGKDEQGCPTMRQFADFAAQFADFVVTLQYPSPNIARTSPKKKLDIANLI
jgi:hypothetical protein